MGTGRDGATPPIVRCAACRHWTPRGQPLAHYGTCAKSGDSDALTPGFPVLVEDPARGLLLLNVVVLFQYRFSCPLAEER